MNKKLNKTKEIKIKKTVDFPEVFKDPLWGDFLREQQVIGYLLTYLITSYCENAEETFKNWFKNWISKQSLGKLIDFFKTIVVPHYEKKVFKMYKKEEYKMGEIVGLMDEYKKRRNELTHKVIESNFKTNEEILNYVEETNKKGKRILGALEMLWKEKIDEKKRKPSSTLSKQKIY